MSLVRGSLLVLCLVALAGPLTAAPAPLPKREKELAAERAKQARYARVRGRLEALGVTGMRLERKTNGQWVFRCKVRNPRRDDAYWHYEMQSWDGEGLLAMGATADAIERDLGRSGWAGQMMLGD
jgi:hypothetical protein